MSLKVSTQTFDDVTLFRCTGRIAAGAETDALEYALREGQKTCKQFVLNLREVNFIDSSGMGLLVRFANLLRATDGGLKLSAVSPELVKVLQLTRLDKVLQMYERESDAVKAFQDAGKFNNPPQHGKKVLCIDASLNVQAYLGGLLEAHDFSAITAANAFDAYALLQSFHPALIILGPHVPGAKSEQFSAAIHGIPLLTLGTEFHAGEAGFAAEILMSRVRAMIKPKAEGASNW